MSRAKQSSLTPVMRQYRRIKEKHPDKILFFRMGDFYEMFYEDAVEASRILGIALTSRQEGVPMAGVPHHSATTYIRRLLEAGHTIAICEQLEGQASKTLMQRDVVRVITPGTVVEEEFLPGKAANHIAAAYVAGDICGVAWADVSTGEFLTTQDAKEALVDHILRVAPVELLLPENCEEEALSKVLEGRCAVRWLPPWRFDAQTAHNFLIQHFGVHDLSGFGLQGLDAAVAAAGALLQFLSETHRSVNHIKGIKVFRRDKCLVIDATTARALELVRTATGQSGEGTLLYVLDKTKTPMGLRLLRQWLLAPLVERAAIEARLDAVEELCEKQKLRTRLRELLQRIGDLERLITRVVVGRANARDLVHIASGLEVAALIKAALCEVESPLLKGAASSIEPAAEICEKIRNALVDSPPQTIKEGGLFRPHYDTELDRLREFAESSKRWLSEYEERLRRQTAVPNLKCGYNRLFGYYVEVPRNAAKRMPQQFRPLQTLKNAQRYTTAELKKFERESLGAKERACELEYELFCRLREEVAEYAPYVARTAESVAELDCLAALAEVALQNGYKRPQIVDEPVLFARASRHPVLEQTCQFVPNDINLDANERQILLVTGPNMAGKSTYIRQVALLVIMAQMGSFVPAEEAQIGIVDRVFTRVGASDELFRGRSTFLVEMAETANILNNATPKSLIILDEIGRGTSTFDGMAIAWSVTEFLHERVGARTLFATHYHELTAIAHNLPRVSNLCVQVVEHQGKVVFLHKVAEGAAERSYGISVAEIAGVPREVTERAREVLAQLEAQTEYSDGAPRIPPPKKRPRQITLFDTESRLAEALREIDINNITPVEALLKLRQLRQLLGLD